jgi:hypothetical protein
MKKIIALIIFLCVLSVIGCGRRRFYYNQQAYVQEWGITEREANRQSFYHDTENTSIELIGWSKDGLAAVRYRCNIVAKYNSRDITFAIVNTVTNEIIEVERINVGPLLAHSTIIAQNPRQRSVSGPHSWAFLDENDSIRHHSWDAHIWSTLDDFIEYYKRRWNWLLVRYRINGKIDDIFADISQDDLQEPTVGDYSVWFDYMIRKDLAYRYVFNWSRFMRREEAGLHRRDVMRWKLMIGDDDVQRIIAEMRKKPYMFMRITGRIIHGYYKSPYENRIVVVVSMRRGINTMVGNQYHGRLEFYGFNLDDMDKPRRRVTPFRAEER